MSTYKREPGDLAVQVYLPRALGLEIGKLRLESRSTNNVVITELLVEALTARGLLFSSDELDQVLAPAPETKESNAGTSGKEIKSGKPRLKKEPPGPPYVMRNPQKSLIAAVRGAKTSQEKLATLNKPTPAPVTEVTVADSVIAVDRVMPHVLRDPEPVVVAAPVVDDPFSEFLDDEPAPVAKPAAKAAAPEDDDEIDIAALAAIDDDEPLVMDPFKLVS